MADLKLPRDFQTILDEVAAMLIEEVRAEMADKAWRSLFYDYRREASGDMRISKLRIVLPDGKLSFLDEPPIEKIPVEGRLAPLFNKLWKIRGTAFADKWYGIKITIQADGKCEVDFDYDPECVADPTFFDE
jgi:hypothetical protein